MKNFVLISSLLAVSSLSACGDGTAKKESVRTSTGATQTVIAKVDKNTNADGASAVTFSGSAASTQQIKNTVDAEQAFLSGQVIGAETEKTGGVVVTPGNPCQSPCQGPVQGPNQGPSHGPNQGPIVKPIVSTGPVMPPVYTPVEPYPGNIGVVQKPISGGCGPVQGPSPCQQVVANPCGCGWDFPILRAAASVVGIAGQILISWNQAVHVDVHSGPVIVKPIDGSGYFPNQGPVQGPVVVKPIGTPNQAPDKQFQQNAPMYKNANGQDVNYGYSQKYESDDAYYYIYSR